MKDNVSHTLAPAQQLVGWQLARPAILRGDKPPNTVTLAELAQLEVQNSLRPLTDQSSRSAYRPEGLAVLHMAAMAVHALIAGWAFDALVLRSGPDQIGIVVDQNQDPIATWIGACDLDPSQSGGRAGAIAFDLLEPVAEVARARARVGSRGISNLVYDLIASGCERMARDPRVVLGPKWPQAVMDGTGVTPRLVGHTLLVRPDGGPPVEMYVPRTCCALLPQATPDVCPTCPLLPDDDTRRRNTVEWLTSLDGEEFQYMTGRQPTRRSVGPIIE